MGILSGLTTSEDVQEVKDSVGGSFAPVESGLYKLTVVQAYVDISAGGAMALKVDFKSSNEETVRQAFWMTSGKAKGSKNYYLDKKGNKQYLPGFNQANALSQLTLEKNIADLEPEDKIIDLYDPASKSQIPTKVDMVTELIGKTIVAGVIKQKVNKNVKNDEGKYVPTAEIREENEIDKFFRASDGKTLTEIKANTDAVFNKKWNEKWSGKIKDRTVKVTEASKTAAPSTSNLFA